MGHRVRDNAEETAIQFIEFHLSGEGAPEDGAELKHLSLDKKMANRKHKNFGSYSPSQIAALGDAHAVWKSIWDNYIGKHGGSWRLRAYYGEGKTQPETTIHTVPYTDPEDAPGGSPTRDLSAALRVATGRSMDMAEMAPRETAAAYKLAFESSERARADSLKIMDDRDGLLIKLAGQVAELKGEVKLAQAQGPDSFTDMMKMILMYKLMDIGVPMLGEAAHFGRLYLAQRAGLQLDEKSLQPPKRPDKKGADPMMMMMMMSAMEGQNGGGGGGDGGMSPMQAMMMMQMMGGAGDGGGNPMQAMMMQQMMAQAMGGAGGPATEAPPEAGPSAGGKASSGGARKPRSRKKGSAAPGPSGGDAGGSP